MESALVPITQGLSNLIPQAATAVGTDVAIKAATPAIGKIIGDQTGKTVNLAFMNSGSQNNQAINKAFSKLQNYKAQNAPSIAEKGLQSFGNDDFNFAFRTRNNRQALADAIGEDNLLEMEDALGGMLKMGNANYDTDLSKAINYLQSPKSTAVAQRSQSLVQPGTTIFRAQNSPTGISWTTNKEVAEKALDTSNKYVQDLIKKGINPIAEHTLTANDRYIAPHFTEYLNQSVYPQQEVLFNYGRM